MIILRFAALFIGNLILNERKNEFKESLVIPASGH